MPVAQIHAFLLVVEPHCCCGSSFCFSFHSYTIHTHAHNQSIAWWIASQDTRLQWLDCWSGSMSLGLSTLGPSRWAIDVWQTHHTHIIRRIPFVLRSFISKATLWPSCQAFNLWIPLHSTRYTERLAFTPTMEQMSADIGPGNSFLIRTT